MDDRVAAEHGHARDGLLHADVRHAELVALHVAHGDAVAVAEAEHGRVLAQERLGGVGRRLGRGAAERAGEKRRHARGVGLDARERVGVERGTAEAGGGRLRGGGAAGEGGEQGGGRQAAAPRETR